MTDPLGPTPGCASIADLDSDVPADLKRVQAHALACRVCTEALRAYALVKAQSRPAQPKAVWSKIGIEFPAGVFLDECVEFNLKLYAPPGVSIAPESLMMQGIVEQVRCEQLQLIEDDPLVGSCYVTKCIGRMRRDLIDPSQVNAAADFADWIKVSGRTSSGEPFSRDVLVRLLGRPAPQP